MINWMYADKYGELPPGEAEKIEALVKIAEQIDKLNETMKQFDRFISIHYEK